MEEVSPIFSIYKNIVVPEEGLCFFKFWLSILGLHEYIGTKAVSRDQRITDCSLISVITTVLDRFGVFKATFVASSWEDSNDNVGGRGH